MTNKQTLIISHDFFLLMSHFVEYKNIMLVFSPYLQVVKGRKGSEYEKECRSWLDNWITGLFWQIVWNLISNSTFFLINGDQAIMENREKKVHRWTTLSFIIILQKISAGRCTGTFHTMSKNGAQGIGLKTHTSSWICTSSGKLSCSSLQDENNNINLDDSIAAMAWDLSRWI